jgi:putative Ca2+/H+ antiporter (TMEM165/GDT1 family)
VFVGDRVAVFVGDRVAVPVCERVAVFVGDRVAVHVMATLVRVIVAVLLGSHGNGIDVVGSAVITA